MLEAVLKVQGFSEQLEQYRLQPQVANIMLAEHRITGLKVVIKIIETKVYKRAKERF